jgi:CubicO group peptidase (beta-lactamase class C family)
MSKAFTATALGLVMDDFAHGRNTTPLPPKVKAFTVQSKLADLLPGDWKLMDDYASKKTAVHDLLTHESGMPRYVNRAIQRC